MDMQAIIDTAAVCALAVGAYLCLALFVARCCSLNHTAQDDEQ